MRSSNAHSIGNGNLVNSLIIGGNPSSPVVTVEGLGSIGKVAAEEIPLLVQSSISSVQSTMTTQIASANKTPFSISDILTDLKVQEEKSESGVKQMIYGINSREDGLGGYESMMSSAVRKRMDDKTSSGGGGSTFVRRGSLECFLIENNKNQTGAYYGEQQSPLQKPLDMRRSVASSLSDTYDSGEGRGGD